MSNAPFLRPMFAGFAVTATAILVMPICARAQTPSVASQCGAPAPKAHGFKLGRLLSAAQNSGVMPLLGGRGGGVSLAASLATTAIDAANQSHAEADRQAAARACPAPEQ